MNHWSLIRLHARKIRAEALKKSNGDTSPETLLNAVAEISEIGRQGLPTGHNLLCGAKATIDSFMVWFDYNVEKWEQCFNQMHEYAHHFLEHGRVSVCFPEDFDSEASEDAVAFGEKRVEGYGPHERCELEANLFAREFFLPCDELQDFFLKGENADSISDKFEMHSGMVIHQLMRAVLGIEAETKWDEISGEQQAASSNLDLDKYQKKAAFIGLKEFKNGEYESPVLVDAGPGTGKTRTLTARISHLINDRGIKADQILALTYSNKAAEEMYTRVSKAVSQNASKIWMGTFHKFCLDLIRKNHEDIKISSKPIVADEYDLRILLEQSLNRLNLKYYRSLTRPNVNFRRILTAISRVKDELISPEQYINLALNNLKYATNKKVRENAGKHLEIANVYKIYQKILKEKDLLDYGDLLYFAVDFLKKNESAREKIQSKYKYILIDEYQDVNTASRELLKLIAGDSGNGLWVVGDIRQAIYRFRGAAPVNMLLLTKEDYPNTKVCQLSENYRNKHKIVEIFTGCSNEMITQVDNSKINKWEINNNESSGEINYILATDEFSEAQELVESIKHLHKKQKINYRDQAVLCRYHNDLVHYSNALETAGISVLYLGDFFERAEIRDMLCVIDFASGMDGRAVFRFAGFEEYNFSFKDAGELITYSLKNKLKFPRALKKGKDLEKVSQNGKSVFAKVNNHFKGFHPTKSSAWTILSQYLFNKSNYLRELVKETAPQTMQKRIAIYQLLLLTYQLREKFPDSDGDPKKQFLDYIRQIKISGLEKVIRQTPHWADAIDAVRMLTVHAAKGLEFRAVHLPALSDGKFSTSAWSREINFPEGVLKPEMIGWETEEEQCLFFVALSRACDVLNLYRAESYDSEEKEPSTLLKLISSKLPEARRAVEKSKSQPPLPKSFLTEQSIKDFDVKELMEFIECPLKYKYRHILKIPYFFSESPITKARLCVSKVWNILKKEKRKNLPVNQEIILEVFEEIWAEHGPINHPYAHDYRKEALNMIYWTLETHPPETTAVIKPTWQFRIKNAKIAISPDYLKKTVRNKEAKVTVERLNFGKYSNKSHKDSIYAFYEEAALQKRKESNVRIEISASFMTDQITRTIIVPIVLKKQSIFDLEEAVDRINNGIFPLHKSKDCPMCPYYFICDAKEQ